MNEIIIPEYTKEDFLSTEAPYEWLYSNKDDVFLMGQLGNVLKEKAISFGITNFPTLFKTYMVVKTAKNNSTVIFSESIVKFPTCKDCDTNFKSGVWKCNSDGVFCEDSKMNEIVACNHPIFIYQRLVNVDSRIEKLKLKFYKGGRWRDLIADKKTLASNTSIVQLADFGIAVNSETSKYLVRYLTDFEHLNYTEIKEYKSIERCGWIKGLGFSPYVGNLIFDGESSYRQMFDAIVSGGDEKKWFDLALDVRKNGSIPARIILASSFASILIEICGGLPFIVHVWGESGTGKTVALMLAASVWADPREGGYIKTFEATAVGMEMLAGFTNNLPLILDELQLVKDAKERNKIVYKLAEGLGKIRGAKMGGMQRTLSWKNCILTSGEEPITNTNSDGGAINRTIEINCSTVKLFKNPRESFLILKNNYGFAGKQFVELMSKPENVEMAEYIQGIINNDLEKRGVGGSKTAGKQNLAASLILTADQLIDCLIFKDNCQLDYDDISPYLSTVDDISTGKRAFNWLSGWIAQNSNKLNVTEWNIETWGKCTETQIFVIGNVFDKACTDNNFNPQTVLSWLDANKHIESGKDGFKKTQSIGNHSTRCVCFYKKAFENINIM